MIVMITIQNTKIRDTLRGKIQDSLMLEQEVTYVYHWSINGISPSTCTKLN
jgi:formylmethanofuran:tetrahydromethanopterin formyltransferase